MIHELRSQSAKIICLGVHPGIIQSVLDYDYLCGREAPSIVAIIAHGRKQERFFWGEREVALPVHASLSEIDESTRHAITAILNVLSARRVLESSLEALTLLPNLMLLDIFAEGVPEQHALQLARAAKSQKVIIVGPASVGVLLPGTMKLGAIGGTQAPQIEKAKISAAGDTAVISTSGGMVNEIIHTVTANGLGVSMAVALGGERFPTLTPAEAFLLAEADTKTRRIVYFGELGGADEYDIAQLIAQKKITKDVIAYIAGTVAELFETPPQFGHAGAMANTQQETASAKKEILRSVNVAVVDTFGELAALVVRIAKEHPFVPGLQARTIGARYRRPIASHVSGDVAGDVQLLGNDLLMTVESHSVASLTLSMLLGEPVHHKKLVDFTDYVLRLLVDHGPYVSGAVNTIVAARAGKDLVSSLAAGLLTIGPRFGGAINEAAACWLRGTTEQQLAPEFVESFTSKGGIIPGIGHKKYRIEQPDPRVMALLQFASNSNEDRYTKFALSVQAVTTAKKGNLILNVDGAIAAVLLDLLESELGYTKQQLESLVQAEFFNALFVISRSIGFTAHFIDQRRHDEGLFRLGANDVAYLG